MSTLYLMIDCGYLRFSTATYEKAVRAKKGDQFLWVDVDDSDKKFFELKKEHPARNIIKRYIAD